MSNGYTYVIKPVTINETNLLYSSLGEDGFSFWVSGYSYLAGVRCMSNHALYECILAVSGTTPPEADVALVSLTPHWIYVQPTNRWAMYNGAMNVKSSHPSNVTQFLSPGGVTAFTAFGVVGIYYTVTMLSNTTQEYGCTWDESADTYATYPAPAYIHTEVLTEAVNTILLTDLPSINTGIIQFTLIGANPSINFLGCGIQTTLGYLQYGASYQIKSYGYRSWDSWGNYVYQQRGYSYTYDFMLKVPKESRKSIKLKMESIIDIPCVWIGTDVDGFEDLSCLGIYESFNPVLDYVDWSSMNLKITSLSAWI